MRADLAEYIRQVDLLCAARGLVVRVVPADVFRLARRTFADLWELYARARAKSDKKRVAGEALVVRDMLRRELRTGMCDVLGEVDSGNNFVYESLRGAVGYADGGCALTPPLQSRRAAGRPSASYGALVEAQRRQSYADDLAAESAFKGSNAHAAHKKYDRVWGQDDRGRVEPDIQCRWSAPHRDRDEGEYLLVAFTASDDGRTMEPVAIVVCSASLPPEKLAGEGSGFVFMGRGARARARQRDLDTGRLGYLDLVCGPSRMKEDAGVPGNPLAARLRRMGRRVGTLMMHYAMAFCWSRHPQLRGFMLEAGGKEVVATDCRRKGKRGCRFTVERTVYPMQADSLAPSLGFELLLFGSGYAYRDPETVGYGHYMILHRPSMRDLTASLWRNIRVLHPQPAHLVRTVPVGGRAVSEALRSRGLVRLDGDGDDDDALWTLAADPDVRGGLVLGPAPTDLSAADFDPARARLRGRARGRVRTLSTPQLRPAYRKILAAGTAFADFLERPHLIN